MTLFSTLGQAREILTFLLVGVAVGVVFSVGDGIAKGCKGTVARAVLDVLCFVFSAAIGGVSLQFVARFRLYLLLAVFLGVAIERASLSILLANLFDFVYNKARRAKEALARRKERNEKQLGSGKNA